MAVETGIIQTVIILCVVFLVVFAGIEAIVLLYSYFNADKVTCTWLWCEFTTERTANITISTTERGTTNITISRECRINGVIVNCSDADNLTRTMSGLGYKASEGR